MSIYDSKTSEYQQSRGLIAGPQKGEKNLPTAGPNQKSNAVGPAPKKKKKGDFESRKELYLAKDPKEADAWSLMESNANSYRSQVENKTMPMQIAMNKIRADYDNYVSTGNKQRAEKGLSVTPIDFTKGFDVDEEVSKLTPFTQEGVDGALTNYTATNDLPPSSADGTGSRDPGMSADLVEKQHSFLDKLGNSATAYKDTITDFVSEGVGNVVDQVKSDAGWVGDQASAVGDQFSKEVGPGVDAISGVVGEIIEDPVGVALQPVKWGAEAYEGEEAAKAGQLLLDEDAGKTKNTPKGALSNTPTDTLERNTPKGTGALSSTNTETSTEGKVEDKPTATIKSTEPKKDPVAHTSDFSEEEDAFFNDMDDQTFTAFNTMAKGNLTPEKAAELAKKSGKSKEEIAKIKKEYSQFYKNQENTSKVNRENNMIANKTKTATEQEMEDEAQEEAMAKALETGKGVNTVVSTKDPERLSAAELRQKEEEGARSIAQEKAAFAGANQDADNPYSDPTFLSTGFEFLKNLLITENFGKAWQGAEDYYKGEQGKRSRWQYRDTLLEQGYPPRVADAYIRTGDNSVLDAEDERIKTRAEVIKVQQEAEEAFQDTRKKLYENNVLTQVPAEDRARYEETAIKQAIAKSYQEHLIAANKEVRDQDLHPLEKQAKASAIALNAARAEDLLTQSNGTGSGKMTSSVTGREIPSERLTEGKRKAAAGASDAQAGLQSYNRRIESGFEQNGGPIEVSAAAANYAMANPSGAFYSATGESDTTRWLMDSVQHYAREAGIEDAGALAQLHTAEASFIYPMLQAKGLSINPQNYMATRARYFPEMGGTVEDRAIKAYERDRAIEAAHLTAGNFAGNGQTLHMDERNVVSAAITGLSGGIQGYAKKPNDPDNYYKLNPGYAKRYGLDPSRPWSLPEIRAEVLRLTGEQRGWGKPTWLGGNNGEKTESNSPSTYDKTMKSLGY